MKFLKKIVNNIKYKYPWEQYYKKGERNINVPDISIYEYLVASSEFNLNSTALNYFHNKTSFKQFLSPRVML